jgi:hypothetical protein
LFCKEPELYKSTIASNGYCINENLWDIKYAL